MRNHLLAAPWVAVLTVLSGCSNPSANVRLNQVEQSGQRDDETIDSLADRVAKFEREVDEVVALYVRASGELKEAQRRYEDAHADAEIAADAFERARQDYETATRNWHLVTISLLTAATWDYAGYLCNTRMTTSEYRRELRSKGIDLEGLDADHGLPRSRSGADHPLNYKMIDSSLNRSLGNDMVRKLLTHPTHLLRGATVSALMRLRCSPQL